jgi:NAD(P)-dependent dehydrogenase (short-subunit alcohol dehydrogenase family)
VAAEGCGLAKRRIAHPLGRIGELQEIASIAVFLTCQDSSYVTGQTVMPMAAGSG